MRIRHLGKKVLVEPVLAVLLVGLVMVVTLAWSAGVARAQFPQRIDDRFTLPAASQWIAAADTSAAPNTDANARVKDTTYSDLSDMPNVEQMDYGKFQRNIGNVPHDRRPLLNLDNPRVKVDRGDKQINEPADLTENPEKTKAENPRP
jgi:hypothetical protein